MKWTVMTAMFLGLSMAPDSAKDDINKKDLEKMQGDWAVLSMVADGTKISDDDAQVLFRTVKGNQYTVFLFKKPLSGGTFTIDASKQPKQIDAAPDNTPDKKPLLGIYELDGDKYKTCFARAGKDRPTDFTAKEGSGHTLTIWERENK
jgi:uncharacterized protein (TIGR03067 family)